MREDSSEETFKEATAWERLPLGRWAQCGLNLVFFKALLNIPTFMQSLSLLAINSRFSTTPTTPNRTHSAGHTWPQSSGWHHFP